MGDAYKAPYQKCTIVVVPCESVIIILRLVTTKTVTNPWGLEELGKMWIKTVRFYIWGKLVSPGIMEGKRPKKIACLFPRK